MQRSLPALTSLLAAVLVLAHPAPAWAADGPALAREGEGLYRNGAYIEALKRFEAATAAGYETPALLYQLATCYGQGMQNKEKEVELKKKAVPLLEKEISAGSASTDAYYYLAAIYVNDLNDPVKGNDVARKGVAALEKKTGPAPAGQDGNFRAGRLYSFLGKDKEAISYYERSIEAASAPGAVVDRAALKRAQEDVASYHMRQKNYDAAARAYGGIVKGNPLADEERHEMGRALLLAGKPDEAITAWQGAQGDDLRTELNYLAAVVRKWRSLGQPSTSTTAPKFASLDDEALQQQILAAAEPLRKIREKEAKALEEREAKIAAEREAQRQADMEARKAKGGAYKAKRKVIESADPNMNEAAPDPWSTIYAMGLHPEKLEAMPAPSAEKLAAEKEFFVLLVESVKRDRLIRGFCFENGLVEMIFR